MTSSALRQLASLLTSRLPLRRRDLPIRNVYGVSLRAARLAAAAHRRPTRPLLRQSTVMTRQVALVVITAFAATALSPLPTALLGRLPGGDTQYDVPAANAQTSGCRFSQPVTPALCETFDAPAGTGNRSGDLNGTLWGVSRTTGNTNPSQNVNDGWWPTTLQGCGGSRTVQPPHDIVICNGRVYEASDDGHTITALAMYPKQPFDFAGRTGTVVFDVTNDTHGSHAAWPEFWMSDAPVPVPFTHGADWLALPRHGFGLRFYSYAAPGQAPFQNCPNDGNPRWTVTHGSVVVSRNWVLDDPDFGGSTHVNQLGCVIAPTSADGGMNHVELRISQNQIDIYATDAGTTGPLIHLGVVENANLTFTRGLIWLEDVHYNASKGPCCQTEHTFSWDNVGFDGPVTGRDHTFDVLDALTPAGDGSVNLGWRSTDSSGVHLTTQAMTSTDIASAGSAALLLNFAHYVAPITLNYSVNGHSYSQPWQYPETRTYTWRTTVAPINLTDLVAGSNQITISAGSDTIVVANVDILLRPGGVGASSAPPTATPASGAPTATRTPVPATATSTAVPPTATPAAARTATPTPGASGAVTQPTATRTPVPPSPTTRPANTATSVPATATQAPPTATSVAVSSSGTIKVTFNDLPSSPEDQALNGIYPAGLINWGTGLWELSAPWGQMTTNNLELARLDTSGTFSLLTPKRLSSLKVFNGAPTTSLISLSCPGQPTRWIKIAAGTIATVEVGWTGPCTSVTITSNNGPLTHFDDLVFTS